MSKKEPTITLTHNQLEQLLTNVFNDGNVWGETYGGWFVPTEQHHKDKLNECLMVNMPEGYTIKKTNHDTK